MSLRADSVLAITTLILGIICLALQIVILLVPYWGSFTRKYDDSRTTLIDVGHFGPWKICLDDQWMSHDKRSTYETLCQPGISRYIPPSLTTVAGVLAVVNAVLLFQYIPLAILHIVKVLKHNNDKVMKTKALIVIKIILTILIAILSVSTLGLFAGSKSPSKMFSTDFEWGFYIIVVIVVLSFGLTGVTEAEYFVHKRMDDKERRSRDPSGQKAETYGNPGFGTPKTFNHIQNTSTISTTRNGKFDQSSHHSSATNTLSTVNQSTDSDFLETAFNGYLDRSAMQKIDPAMDTGASYSNPHFHSSSSPPSSNKNFRKNTQV